MRIAQIAPLYEAVPPRLYGGTERVVAHLTEALVEQGHDVTLFAAADARTSARLAPMRERSLRLDPQALKSDVAAHLGMLHALRDRADEFDVLHFHIDLLHFPFFEHIAGRTLTTLHGRLDLADLPQAYRRWSAYPLVSISDHQRTPLREANWMATVPHGLDPRGYRFAREPAGGYLAFLGRISPEKRPDRAIRIAREAGIPLKIAAKVDNADRDYFEQTIRPLLDGPGVEFIGEIGDATKSDFLGNARALLFPIDWPEPFGLVMIEAMACGTPVIAWNHGSVPEVVDDGVTGFVVDDIPQAVEAVSRAHMLDRALIRRVFEQQFTAQAMANRYVQLYMRLARQDRVSMMESEAA
ncbi:glycosyltransferase family 4 protein [Bordetella genomosp. 9]|uniref:Glycosyl transferase n=1 Tax=Bordetella genomosp. 9 TaxID=1416803 RepID=A0A1W6YYP0_9BORD|nr:glycosyltransferase family 4 protein [Bordetella genomosp. 9]ARP86111.1 glycosyl transferase [Bordetella genomosp. 9]ARP90132.1 glycosyl transferase [Bordetella genomosp. 9]